MQIGDAVERFITYREAENLSPTTIQWYRDHLSVFLEWLPQDTEVADVRSIDVAQFIADQASNTRQPRPLAPYTVRARYSTLRAFFNWLEESDEMGNPPSPIGSGRRKKVKPPKTGEPAKKYIPHDHYLRYVQAIPDDTWQAARDKLLGMVLFWSGVRLQECAQLSTDDISLKFEIIRVKQGKGRKARYVPIAAEVIRPTLLEYLYGRPQQTGNALWLGQTNDSHQWVRPLKPEGIRQILIRRCQQAGIPYYNPHAWRHGFGMWLINCGASMAAVSRAMGHSSVTITEQVYAQMQTPAIQREYAAAVANIKANWDKPLLW